MASPPRQSTASQRSAWVRLWQWLFRGLLFIWVTIVLGLALNVGATWLTTKGFNPTGTPLEFIIQHLPVVIACGGGLLVLTIVARMLGRQNESSVANSQPTLLTQQKRSVLIHLLRNEYRRQMTESLQGITMMALALQQRTDVVLSSVSLVSWRMDAPEEASLPAPASIVQAYDDADSGLLLLGAPGAGKSTLLRELASELIIRAEQDSALPVPVIVNLSSWTAKKPPLTTWLVDQLQLVYAVPRHLSQAWIEQDQLLFLLDGLDEVVSSSRSSCIEAINAYRAEHFVPLVVCSRTREYLTQEERLRLPIAVEVRPLTSEQVDRYLKGVGKPLAAVRVALRSNTVLRDLVTTPLMLSVAMLAYRGKTVKELPQLGSAEQQRRQVLEHYVARMLEQQTRKWHYASQQTRKWLIWLAQQMQHQHLTEFYLERLQRDWLPTKRSQTFYRSLTRLFNGLVSGLLVGSIWGLFGGVFGELSGRLGGPHGWRMSGLLIGLISGLAFGLLIGLTSGRTPRQVFALIIGWGEIGRPAAPEEEIHTQEILKWSWKKARLETVGGTLVGGLLLGVFVWLTSGLLAGVLVWLVLGPLIGLLSGLSSEQVDKDMRVHPNQGIHISGWNGLVFGILGGLIGGLVFGIVFGPFAGLLFALLGGLFGMLSSGGAPYLRHYALRFLLWRSRAIPWSYVHFLEEATERILLQRVGGGYRFIHPLFQEYFASLGTETPISVSPDSSLP